MLVGGAEMLGELMLEAAVDALDTPISIELLIVMDRITTSTLLVARAGTDTLSTGAVEDISMLPTTSDDTSPPPPPLAVPPVPCPPSPGCSVEPFFKVIPSDTLTASPITNTTVKHSTIPNRRCLFLQRLRGVTDPIM